MDDYLLITGASSGVGRVLAQKLSEKYNLILCARSEDGLLATKEKCKKDVILWKQDLSKIEEIEENLANLVKSNDIKIKKFVHCAGDMKMVPCKMIQSELLLSTFSINTFSPVLIIKTLLSRKLNRGALDSVVFISSNISNRGAKAFCAYGASKAALDGVMRNLAVELAPKVRVNSVLPGGMKTKMTEAIFEDQEVLERLTDNNPLGIGSPDYLIPTIELLLSDDARWITGQQIVIDGGRTVDITE